MSEARALVSAETCKILIPDDEVDFADKPRAIMVGDAGNVAFVNPDDSVTILRVLIPGVVYPFKVKRINVAGTTVTTIYGFY